MFEVEALSGNAIEMLGQLYVNGPTWDGNVCSKQGRGELCRAGLAWHAHGYASLTPEGVQLAAGWSIAWLKKSDCKRWLEKIRQS